MLPDSCNQTSRDILDILKAVSDEKGGKISQRYPSNGRKVSRSLE